MIGTNEEFSRHAAQRSRAGGEGGPRRRTGRIAAWPVLAMLAVMSGLLSAGAAHAQASDKYPSRPIRWIVPSPAGAPVDVLARRVG